MASYTTEKILQVHHWSDRLFSFSTTRSQGLRFDSGQFVMLGLDSGDGRRISRAYSIASANYEDHLEFYSIKVPGGAFTSRLQSIATDDALQVSAKPTGTLVLRDLKPGRRLFLLATGTGVAPFMSLIRDPETYDRFEHVYLARGAARLADLAYARSVIDGLEADPYLGEMVRGRLHDYPTTTREPSGNRGRLSTLTESDKLFDDLGIEPLDPAEDRAMVCGNMRMVADMGRILEAKGLAASPGIGVPGDYVIERAFVESSAPKPRAAALTEALAGASLA